MIDLSTSQDKIRKKVGCRWVVVLCCLAAPVAAQRGEWLPLGREVIEARFKQVPHRNGERRRVLKKQFEAAGCTGQLLVEQKVENSRHPNLSCTLDSTIIVGAHYDSVPTSYGAADNWSGASLLPSLLQSLRTPTRKHTFVFIAFTDEEKGIGWFKGLRRENDGRAKSQDASHGESGHPWALLHQGLAKSCRPEPCRPAGECCRRAERPDCGQECGRSRKVRF